MDYVDFFVTLASTMKIWLFQRIPRHNDEGKSTCINVFMNLGRLPMIKEEYFKHIIELKLDIRDN